MYPPDECYRHSAQRYLESSAREYEAEDYAGCCERIASAVEMVGNAYLVARDICFDDDLYDTYGHSIKGRFKDLGDILSEEEIKKMVYSVYPLRKTKEGKRKEYDKGFNAFKYARYNTHRPQSCPHLWVTRKMADNIREKTVPMLELLIERVEANKYYN